MAKKETKTDDVIDTQSTPITKNNNLNVYQRLANLRYEFTKEKINKSGKNMQLGFKYFTLDDIGEACNRLCLRNGLLVQMYIENVKQPIILKDGEIASFTNVPKAYATVINADVPNDKIVFELPFTQASPIINKQGQNISNDIQLMGSSITYYRRYLWNLVLDLTEADGVDDNLGNVDDTPQEKQVSKAPKTPQERKQIKETLTNGEQKASEVEINAIYKVGDKLVEYDDTNVDMLKQLKDKHNGFDTLTSNQANEIINVLSELLMQYEKGDK